ncbi:MAG: DUF922 domain-containing protein [Rhizobiaceae bacterium]|nr:DUF922 domain-containing protein [Rhizobiaceae bacterium]
MPLSFRQALISAAAVLVCSLPAAADWKPVEKEETYAIGGRSGIDLYRSIGERGPKLGPGRAIAHTNFKLTWSRKYETRGSACVLASARPKLLITYTLPKPSGKLPPTVAKEWDVFIAGVRKHERVHGDFIKDMVREIEQATVGLSVDDDPGCTKIKAVMTERLSAISLAQRRRSSDFDRVELGEGGNVHQLVLALVNGSGAQTPPSP